MTGIPLDQVAEPARTAWTALRDDLRSILGGDLLAMWGHGGSASVGDPAHQGDLDTHVILTRPPNAATVQAIEDAEARIARLHGIETDTWYVTIEDAHATDPPRHAWRERRRDTSWALHRAHWLAGRFVPLHGPAPATIVTPPTWDELHAELSRELEHIERHVFEGDTDPYESTYAVLNGSRVLYSVETHDVAISKRQAGLWALQHVPPRWHAAVHAALRSYDQQATADDIRRLAADMAPFVAFARGRVPDLPDRPAGDPPRWSDY